LSPRLDETESLPAKRLEAQGTLRLLDVMRQTRCSGVASLTPGILGLLLEVLAFPAELGNDVRWLLDIPPRRVNLVVTPDVVPKSHT
jgi:hypothetical protein